MNKKILTAVITILMLVPAVGMAQKAKKDYKFTPGSNISLGIGAYQVDAVSPYYRHWGYDPNNPSYYGISYDYNINNPRNDYYINLCQIYDNPNIRKGNGYFSGVVSAEYTYRFKKWFELSGHLTYSGYYASFYEAYSDNLAYKQNVNSFGIMPFVRFIYLDRKYVKLYSGLGVGLSLTFERYKKADNSTIGTIANETFCEITAALNLFGIRVGNRIYGFADLGFGSLGLVRCGIGFKLD